jgi:Ca2+/Na+ antiporter
MHHISEHLGLNQPWKADELGALIGAICVFNALDALATASFVTMGLAAEANPMMALLLNIHPALFVSAKIALVSLGLIILAKQRQRALARFAILLAFSLYALIICYHILGGLLSA